MDDAHPRAILAAIAKLLQAGSNHYAPTVEDLLFGSEGAIEQFLLSNEQLA